MIAVAVCYFIRERKFDYESLGKSFFVCFEEGSEIKLGMKERPIIILKIKTIEILYEILDVIYEPPHHQEQF
jgi:hypothetical protein